MFNDLSSPLTYLQSRRSGRPRDMVQPGPTDDQLNEILALAMRTPDHGKIAPWRFIKVSDAARSDLAALLERAYLKSNPESRPAQIEAAVANAHLAPSLVILIHSPQPNAKVPAWEQELSSGAVGMNLLHAAHSLGFVGGWITGWAAYDETVRAALCQPTERIAGFFYFGSPGQELEERPRPDFAAKVSDFPKAP